MRLSTNSSICPVFKFALHLKDRRGVCWTLQSLDDAIPCHLFAIDAPDDAILCQLFALEHGPSNHDIVYLDFAPLFIEDQPDCRSILIHLREYCMFDDPQRYAAATAQ